MEITRGSLLPGALAARGITVVIDVFRAFTCAPLLFSLGIKESILVATPREAIEMKIQILPIHTIVNPNPLKS